MHHHKTTTTGTTIASLISPSHLSQPPLPLPLEEDDFPSSSSLFSSHLNITEQTVGEGGEGIFPLIQKIRKEIKVSILDTSVVLSYDQLKTSGSIQFRVVKPFLVKFGGDGGNEVSFDLEILERKMEEGESERERSTRKEGRKGMREGDRAV